MRFWYLIVVLLSIFAFASGNYNAHCRLPKETGDTRAGFPRYYFDTTEGKCKHFLYGNTGGNANNFKTMEECNKECRCHLPVEYSLSKAAFPRFFFNITSMKCELFHFGGGNGNLNNFLTLLECEANCACDLDKVVGTGRVSLKRVYFNKEKKTCEEFFYGGEGGNANNFKNLRTCKAACGCNLDKDEGQGGNQNERVYFDNGEQKCKELNYGGEGGNANNFKNFRTCKSTCSCNLDKDEGPGIAAFKRFYYDEEQMKCLAFTYGGIGGNGNNFNSEDACSVACRCNLEKDEGQGDEQNKRFYYDEVQKQCLPFIYGGVGGNGNNFNSGLDCSVTCKCNLEKDVGQGTDDLERWYFDKVEQKCKTFTYGGKGGNGNNFETPRDCNRGCGICDQPLEIGNGDENNNRWYYSKETNNCDVFEHRGGKKNGNNFDNEDGCKDACVIQPPEGE